MTPPDYPADERGLDAELQSLTDDQRVADAVEARRLERELRRQAAESGTLADALRDLGERGDQVAITTSSGRTVTGTIRTLGADFVGLQTAGGTAAMVALDAIELLRPEPGAPVTVGDDRALVVRAGLTGVLTELATDHLRLTLHTRSGERVAGSLRSVGADLIVVSAEDGDAAYVAVSAVSEVALP